MFNFKKIATVLASAVMLSSTVGFAMAANYPEPFVKGGAADAAVVWGANAAISDLTSAIDVQQSLGALVSSSTSTSSAAVKGEAEPLFTGGTKLYINDNLNAVKSVLTKSALPTILKDGSFSGNVETTFTQKIDVGAYPKITFAKQPTSSEDPSFALTLSTAQAKYTYNSTVTFNKAVNFSHADSVGETLEIFGTKYTIASTTSNTDLVLLKSAEKVDLTSDNPSADVTVAGSVYTIELVSSSDTAATIKVTDSTGKSESKEIAEAASKKVNGITVAVINADETNLKLSASVIAGSDKFTLTDGSAVTTGDNSNSIDGTLVDFGTGTPGNLTTLTFSVYAPEADKDAIKPGQSFKDPVYKTFKVDFSGLNIASDSTDSRETINFNPNGDDKMQIKFKDYRGNEKSIMFAKNTSGSGLELMGDDNNRNITVFEGENFHYQEYAMVGNEDEGRLIQLSSVKNGSASGTSDDEVKFKDIFSGDTYSTTWTSDGLGSVDIGGKTFTVRLEGASGIDTYSYNVSLNYPDSSGNDVILYPTIQTSKGALVALYKPKTINLTHWEDRLTSGTYQNVTNLKFPNGDGYTSIALDETQNIHQWQVTSGSTKTNLSTNVSGTGASVTVGQFTYNLTTTGKQSELKVLLQTAAGTADVALPAVMVIEEKDDNSNYEGIIIELEDGATSDDGLGIDTVEYTWSNGNSTWTSTMYSDSKKTNSADLFGVISTLNSADSDQKTAVISYPDEQVYAQIYIAEDSAAITPGSKGSGTGGQVLIVKDSELSSVSGKNLVVVGGSCINTAAAKILESDSPLCTSSFTQKTGVGAGQYIIKTVKSPWSDSKVAILVAGYEAADTVNAVKKALEGVTTDSGTSQVYPIASA